eukprot:985040-Rhodomonas_salina.1
MGQNFMVQAVLKMWLLVYQGSAYTDQLQHRLPAPSIARETPFSIRPERTTHALRESSRNAVGRGVGWRSPGEQH